MCSFMTKPSHSGLMYHLSLLPQTLCSSHTAPSPHLLAFLCAASSSKNVLSDYSLLLPFPKPSLPVLYLLTFQEPDQAFPSPRSLLWPPVLDWDDTAPGLMPILALPPQNVIASFCIGLTHFSAKSQGKHYVYGACWKKQLMKFTKRVLSMKCLHWKKFP